MEQNLRAEDRRHLSKSTFRFKPKCFYCRWKKSAKMFMAEMKNVFSKPAMSDFVVHYLKLKDAKNAQWIQLMKSNFDTS